MTVQESTARAKALMSGYKYLYGAKGELYTKAAVEKLAKQYKSKYTAALKAEALKDADKGYKAGDCSFFVCYVLGLSMINSTAIKNLAVELIKPNKAKAQEGMALWKNGHVAYIGDGLKVYEFKSTKEDAVVSTWEKRAGDFTYMFVVKGSPLHQQLLSQAIATTSIYYPKYTGKSSSIVDALAAVGEKDTSFAHRKRISAANGQTGYEGSIKQNNELVKLIKAGKLKKSI